MTSQMVLHGSTSGTATLLAAAVSGAAVLTFPAATGTVALLADVTGGIATHAALQTGVHGISIAAGKTFTASNTLTLTATDGSTLAIGAGGTLGSAAYTASSAYEAAGGIATHAALQTGVHGISITAGKTLSASNTLTLTATDGSTLAIGTGGTLGSAAYTATSAYEAAGGIATHAALTTGVHGLAITAGQTLTVTTGGTLGSAAYTASTAYEAAGGIATHAALTATHGVSGAIVGTTDAQTLTNKTITTFGGAFTFNPANLSATLSPTGTGTVTINPATAGAMNNMVIGGSTPLAGTFTTLTASGLVSLTKTGAAIAIGVTPEAWHASGYVMRIGAGAAVHGNVTDERCSFLSNAYEAASDGNWKYITTQGAAQVLLDNGDTSFNCAASGTAGTNITWIAVARVTTNGLTHATPGAFRMPDGARIGADSTNNLLDDASTGAGTATLYIGNASINVTSDRRLKANIKAVVDTYSDAAIWDMVDRSRVVTHTWNDPSDKAVNNRNTRGPFVGLIAQEQKEATPWAVNKPLNEADPWFIEHVHLVPLLMRDAQITHGHIRDHEEDIEALKAWKGRAQAALAERGITVH